MKCKHQMQASFLKLIVVFNTYFSSCQKQIVVLLAVQIVLIKLTNGKKKLAQNTNFETEGNCKKKGDCLECKPPFHLHTFPGPIICKQLREAWIKAVRQEPFDKKGSWQPVPCDRVCSIHFVDG